MSFQFTCLYYTMWGGVVLASTVLLPLPRILRKPLVKGLQLILTNKLITPLIYLLLSWALLTFIQSFTNNRYYNRELIEARARSESMIEGVSQFELEKTVTQTRMRMFEEQRNSYLSSFALILFATVFTYLKSLKKLDAQLDEEEKLQQRINAPKSAIKEVKK